MGEDVEAEVRFLGNRVHEEAAHILEDGQLIRDQPTSLLTKLNKK